jgi:hypothetical protein
MIEIAAMPQVMAEVNGNASYGPAYSALRTFSVIADLCGLTEEQRRPVQGMPSRSRYRNLVNTAHKNRFVTLDVYVLTWIVAIVGIEQAPFAQHDTE